MADYFIVMGDVVRSKKLDGFLLGENLKTLLSHCNDELSDKISSPYVTTLGDEFQGVANSLKGAMESVIFIDEGIIRNDFNFKIRYVVLFGTINSKINRRFAYDMRGPGLSMARELLSAKRRGRSKFQFALPANKLADNLTKLGTVLEGIAGRWRYQDNRLIMEMITNPNNKEVAQKFNKNRSQIWKRRKNLLIEEYRLTKDVMFDLVIEDQKQEVNLNVHRVGHPRFSNR